MPINTDRTRLPDRSNLTWLFFKTSGRVSRAAYFLGGLLVAIIQAFPLYRFTLVAETSGTSEVLAMIFWLALILSVWSNITLGIKRLHDLGQPGIVAVALSAGFTVTVTVCGAAGHPLTSVAFTV